MTTMEFLEVLTGITLLPIALILEHLVKTKYPNLWED